MEILQYLADHFEVCWKQHKDAAVPSFDEEKVNIYEFNHDKCDPLRNKDYNVIVHDDHIRVFWLCQEEWNTSLYGMKTEIKRWAEYWVRQYREKIDVDSIKIIVDVEDRDGYKCKIFSINVKANQE